MTITDTVEQIHELGRHWAEAEQRGDSAALAAMTIEEFTFVGPAGFVLDRDRWLARYPNGELVTHSLAWDEVTVRDYGDAAVAVGVHTQQASFRGHPADGSFRATHIAVRRDGRWFLAGIHLSPVGGPPPFAAAIELNHTIVRVRDKQVSAPFLAGILGVDVAPPWGPFLPLALGNGVVLEYLDVGDGPVQSQHYAFLVSDDVFDAAYTRIREAGLSHWADPFHQQPGRINQNYGGRGVYFDDPDGHSMELLTVTYGDRPAG